MDKQERKRLILAMLAALAMVGLYFFFTLTDPLLFWLDAAFLAGCAYTARKILTQKK